VIFGIGDLGILSTDLNKIPQYKILRIPAELTHMDRHDGANMRFSQLCKRG